MPVVNSIKKVGRYKEATISLNIHVMSSGLIFTSTFLVTTRLDYLLYFQHPCDPWSGASRIKKALFMSALLSNNNNNNNEEEEEEEDAKKA